MKHLAQKSSAIFALMMAMIVAFSFPAQADETGFTLEDSIHRQIFLELRANVHSLYENGSLSIATDDIAVSTRVTRVNVDNSVNLPKNLNVDSTKEGSSVKNIN